MHLKYSEVYQPERQLRPRVAVHFPEAAVERPADVTRFEPSFLTITYCCRS